MRRLATSPLRSSGQTLYQRIRAELGDPRIKSVFARTFARPPRLMLTNPVAIVFSTYYAYTYGNARFRLRLRLLMKTPAERWFLNPGLIYLFLVTVGLLFGERGVGNQSNLFTYSWPTGTRPLSYIGLGEYIAEQIIIHRHVQRK